MCVALLKGDPCGSPMWMKAEVRKGGAEVTLEEGTERGWLSANRLAFDVGALRW